jgi:lactate dehydrogenase-like 2-hydroxyacid dehydrogenase
VVVNCAVGFDNINNEAATRRGVMVTNTPGALTDATADLAFTLILAAARRVPEADTFLRAGRYRHWKLHQEQLGLDVFGRTLGLFGLGKIGQAVAYRARRGFDMRCSTTTPSAWTVIEQELRVQYVSFKTLLAESEIISIHVPLTPETHHALSADVFEAMKPTAIMVNTARGPVIDEGALVDALRNWQIWGVGLDVYEYEAEVHPGLIELHDRVVLLPHLGSATERTRLEMSRMALAKAPGWASCRATSSTRR